MKLLGSRASAIALSSSVSFIFLLLLAWAGLLQDWEEGAYRQLFRVRGPLESKGEKVVICRMDDEGSSAGQVEEDLMALKAKTIVYAVVPSYEFPERRNSEWIASYRLRDEYGEDDDYRDASGDCLDGDHRDALLSSRILSSLSLVTPSDKKVWPEITRMKYIRFPEALTSSSLVSGALGFDNAPKPLLWAPLVLAFADKGEQCQSEERINFFPSLSLRAVAAYKNATIELESARDHRSPILSVGDQVIKVDRRGMIGLNFRGPPGSIDTVDSCLLADNEENREKFAGKIVFVGRRGGNDRNAISPYGGDVWDVETLATIADNLLDEDYIRDGSREHFFSFLAVVLMAPLTSWIVVSRSTKATAAVAAACLLAVWWVLCYIFFRYHNMHLQVISPMMAGGLSLVSALMLQVRNLEHRIVRDVEWTLKSPQFQEWLGEPEKNLTLVLTEVAAFSHQDRQRALRLTPKLRKAHDQRLSDLSQEHRGFHVRYGCWNLTVFQGADNAIDFTFGLLYDRGDEELGVRAGLHRETIWTGDQESFEHLAKRLVRIALLSSRQEVHATEQVFDGLGRERRFGWTRADHVTLGNELSVCRLDVFDVFLFHDSNDPSEQSSMESLSARLRESAIRTWLSTLHNHPSQSRDQMLRHHLYLSRSVLICVGPGSPPPWEKIPHRKFLRKFHKRGKPILLVELDGMKQRPEPPNFLRGLDWTRHEDTERLMIGIGINREQVTKQCRIGFFYANPVGRKPLMLDQEARDIEEKISRTALRDSIAFRTFPAARPDDLLHYLNEFRPRVVHLSGHGNCQDEILVLDKDGAAKPIGEAALRSLFGNFQGNVRLVLLNACYSESQARAITQVIDCAVGMKGMIGDQSAIEFAASFYRALGFGLSVQEAFEQGKTALILADLPEDAWPKLHTRTGVDPSKVHLVYVRDS